jgi:hypothetical protein
MQRSIQNSQREEFYISLSKVGVHYAIGDKSFLCGYTKAQGEAIATLLGACGAAARMNYGPESSAKNSNLGAGLIDYFGYDEGLYFIDSSMSPSKAWMEDFVQTELLQKRPIYCNGSTIENKAHAFLIDGFRYMDSTPYFHVNWGWNGSDNGYFLIDAITTSGNDNYAYSYNLTLGLKPDDGLEDGVLFAAKKIEAATADGKIILTLEDLSNRTIKDFTGNIIIYAIDGQGKEYLLDENHWDFWIAFGRYEKWDKIIDIPQGLPSGEYKIVMRTKESKSFLQKDILTPSNPVIKIENSTAIKDAAITEQPVSEIFSLTGRKITFKEKQLKGLYIINGRKHIYK